MNGLKLVARMKSTFWVRSATTRAARPVGHMAALQLVPPRAKPARLGIIGIACYSSSLRLALHPTGHTAHAVQLPFLGMGP